MENVKGKISYQHKYISFFIFSVTPCKFLSYSIITPTTTHI